MAEQRSAATTPTQPKRRVNLLLLMTLVAVTGILLYYFLSQYYTAQVTAEGDAELAQFELDAQVKSLQPVLEAMEGFYQNHQDWPQNLSQLELDADMAESFASLELAEDGKLLFEGSPAMGPHQDKPLFLEPIGTPGTPEFTWQCSGIDVPAEFLPPYCRS